MKPPYLSLCPPASQAKNAIRPDAAKTPVNTVTIKTPLHFCAALKQQIFFFAFHRKIELTKISLFIKVF
jgi:hypothetical protein